MNDSDRRNATFTGNSSSAGLSDGIRLMPPPECPQCRMRFAAFLGWYCLLACACVFNLLALVIALLSDRVGAGLCLEYHACLLGAWIAIGNASVISRWIIAVGGSRLYFQWAVPEFEMTIRENALGRLGAMILMVSLIGFCLRWCFSLNFARSHFDVKNLSFSIRDLLLFTGAVGMALGAWGGLVFNEGVYSIPGHDQVYILGKHAAVAIGAALLAIAIPVWYTGHKTLSVLAVAAGLAGAPLVCMAIHAAGLRPLLMPTYITYIWTTSAVAGIGVSLLACDAVMRIHGRPLLGLDVSRMGTLDH